MRRKPGPTIRLGSGCTDKHAFQSLQRLSASLDHECVGIYDLCRECASDAPEALRKKDPDVNQMSH